MRAMEFRRQLITAQVALVAVIAVTALMTVVALRSTTTRDSDAYHQLANDLALRDYVRRCAGLLTNATRHYLVDGADVQRSRLAQLQREIAPAVERLASRTSALNAPNANQLEGEVDRYIAWLSAATVEHVAHDEFEHALESRIADLEKPLRAFTDAAKAYGASTIADTDRLARRAQVGVVFTSGIGIAMGLVLGMMARRRLASHFRTA